MGLKNFVKYTTAIFLIAVFIPEALGSKSGGHSKSGKIATPGGKRLAHRGKHILRRLPRETFLGKDEIRSLCEEICAKTRRMDNTKTSNFHSFDPSEKACICIDKTGGLISRSLKKTLSPPSQSRSKGPKNLIASKSHILCNEADSFKTCQLFCKQFPKSDTSKCSDDGTQCLCISMKDKPSRKKRQMDIEEVLDTGDALVSLDVLSPSPIVHRSPKYYSRPPFGHGGSDSPKGSRPFGHGGPVGPIPMPMDSLSMGMGMGCTPYTCMDQCPPGCDSLCRHTQECYCSCPEDLTYDYYEDFSFPSLFG